MLLLEKMNYFFHLCFLVIIIFISTSSSGSTFQPKTLFLAIKRDPSSLQYITHIHQRTPLVPVKLAIHVGGENLWLDCESGYKSSTFITAHCGSRECNLARSDRCGNCIYYKKPRPGCNLEACYDTVANPARETIYGGGEVSLDTLSIQSVNGSTKGPVVTHPNFIFTCSNKYYTENLGKGVKGMIGFGQQYPLSFVTQLATAFRFARKFAICLSPSKNGVIFIGNSPYLFSPGFDASRDLVYTPILTFDNYQFLNRTSPEYYIQVSSIRVNGKDLPLNKTSLSFDEDDSGGTKISTTVPYTILDPNIYGVVSEAFVSKMPKDVKMVPPVQPFKTCFSSTNIGMSRLGYNAPQIDVVLHKPNVYWTITGANSLVKVSEGVLCLAFVERKFQTRQAIVIGGYQMHDNLVEFDLSRGRIGFSNAIFPSNHVLKSILHLGKGSMIIFISRETCI